MYQMSVVNTMIGRAKSHPHPTSDMKKAIEVFQKWKTKNVGTGTQFPFLPLDEIARWEPLANKRKLSEVSRGKKPATRSDYGFLVMYKKFKGDQRKLAFTPVKRDNPSGQDYWSARESFLKARTGQIKARHDGKMPLVALFDKDGLPSNQHIVMIMNGYSPARTKLSKLKF